MTKPVNMTLPERAVSQANDLVFSMNVKSRTAAVENALNLTTIIVSYIKSGKEVHIVDDDGKEHILLISGI